jgi:alpha-1,3/alpha-1,6-mannosyltransferase
MCYVSRLFALNGLSGGYDPRLQDNIETLRSLIELASTHSLSYSIVTPSISTIPIPNHTKLSTPDIVFLLNFTTAQRTALLTSTSTKVLLYTPANEHFGIGPVEGMICGVPILACDSGGPTESIIDTPSDERTGWLRPPDSEVWANTLQEILSLSSGVREALSCRGKERARAIFSIDAMSMALEAALVRAVALGSVDNLIFKGFIILIGFLIAYVSTSSITAFLIPSS